MIGNSSQAFQWDFTEASNSVVDHPFGPDATGR